MSRSLDSLHQALASLDAAWAGAGSADDLSRSQLMAVNEAAGEVQRRLDAVRAGVAARIAFESRPGLGPDSLAKQQGFRTPAKLIAGTTGVSTGEATRLMKVGDAIAPRRDLLGEPGEAKYPLLRDAVESGLLSAQVSAQIVELLDRLRLLGGGSAERISPEQISAAERMLVEKAPGLSLNDVQALIVRAEAWFDPAGVQAREAAKRERRSLTIYERGGAVHLNAVLDAETAAPIRAAIDGFVTAAFRARKDAIDPNAPDADHRPVEAIRADALSTICAHAISCGEDRVPLAGANVVVRMSLSDLDAAAESEAAGAGAGAAGAGKRVPGVATIDGTAQPISITAARRLAADGRIIPAVLGSEGEFLDLGRRARYFTTAQRLMLVERDGGCVMCALPPHMTRVHHIEWWKRDRGRTDLDNGVLLCETCHHRIHDNGWNVRVDGTGAGARVWLIPPPNVDPKQRPRLGGRARFDALHSV